MSIASRLQTIRDNYLTALENDDANPQPNYTAPDGKVVDRTEWRRSLLEAIMDIESQLRKLEPYVVRTRHVTR